MTSLLNKIVCLSKLVCNNIIYIQNYIKQILICPRVCVCVCV